MGQQACRLWQGSARHTWSARRCTRVVLPVPVSPTRRAGSPCCRATPTLSISLMACPVFAKLLPDPCSPQHAQLKQQALVVCSSRGLQPGILQTLSCGIRARNNARWRTCRGPTQQATSGQGMLVLVKHANRQYLLDEMAAKAKIVHTHTEIAPDNNVRGVDCC